MSHFHTERLRKALANVVKAWEAIDSGNHSPGVIAIWLMDDMKPAIDRARKVLRTDETVNTP